MTETYDDQDPFVNEKVISISDAVNSLNLNIEVEMRGENGLLEIISTETEAVEYINTWYDTVDKMNFTVSLDNIQKNTKYLIRFTGTDISSAKLTITSDSDLIKEVEMPNR